MAFLFLICSTRFPLVRKTCLLERNHTWKKKHISIRMRMDCEITLVLRIQIVYYIHKTWNSMRFTNLLYWDTEHRCELKILAANLFCPYLCLSLFKRQSRKLATHYAITEKALCIPESALIAALHSRNSAVILKTSYVSSLYGYEENLTNLNGV